MAHWAVSSSERLRAAALGSALIGAMLAGGVVAGIASAEAAHASQPPKSCMDAPDAEGCPHSDSGPNTGGVWTQYHLVWGDPKGADYFARDDGGNASASDATAMQSQMGYKSCQVYATKYVKCRDR